MSVLSPDRGDESERYMPLLRMLAQRLTIAYRDPLLREELVQAGYIGIMRAAKRYDPDKGVLFTTYAVPWILGEMRTALRNALDADKRYGDRRRVKRARDALRIKLKREPTMSELCSALHIEPYLLCLLDEDDRIVSVDDHRYEHLLRHDAAPEQAGIEKELEEAVEMLDPQARSLIRMRYYADKTQRETALLLGKSQSAISKAEQRALSCLRRLMTEDKSE